MYRGGVVYKTDSTWPTPQPIAPSLVHRERPTTSRPRVYPTGNIGASWGGVVIQ